MMIANFIIRWIVNSFGMWVCLTLFGELTTSYIMEILLIGLVFSLVNLVVKPFVTLLSLPFILLTLGLFTLVVNAGMVGLTVWLVPWAQIGFLGAVLSGILMSFVNYLANITTKPYNISNE
ncbi:MAG: phage holin family protein [Candidatus Nomurabacteria bacterium]|jgi:putative membrane protein|nr:phage holin family protein [Candidatus Nomurabacteria bacterium]